MLMNANDTLYQLSYTPVFVLMFAAFCGRARSKPVFRR